MEVMIHLPDYRKIINRGLVFFLTITVILMGGVAIANEDIIVLLDQSKSMKETEPGNPKKGYETEPFKAKKSHGAIEAINHVIDDSLKEGDYFSLILFGNNVKLLISQQILYKHERELIKSKIKPLVFEDQKTDILASLEEANNLLSALNTPQRRKILVMITDGINDPPIDSPYITPEQQNAIYKKLKDSIHFNKWNVNLVGLGDHTDIDKIAQQLGLPVSNTLIIGDKTSDQIRNGIDDIFRDRTTSKVEMLDGKIKVKLLPRLLGGYEKGQELISLKSSFKEDVQISLNTREPISINSNNDELKVIITPLSLKLGPGQSSQLKITVYFDGKRPEDGRIIKNYFFKFAEGSTIFYPHNSTIEVILPSWWDFYGLYAIIAIIFTIMLLAFAFLAIRRSQVPEIRISVVANDKPLGEAMTLKSKETFAIANQHFAGKVVSAKGLNCKIAANVRYLGRRKFAIAAAEAKVIVEGKEVNNFIVGMDKGFFDLKDKDGKVLRLITITNPVKNDPFGGGHGNDPF